MRCHTVSRRNSSKSLLLAAAWLGTGIGGIGHAQMTTWAGPLTGSWSLPANWNNGIPNAVGVTALVDGGNAQATTVTVDGSFSVGTLTISAGDEVAIAPSQSFTVGTLGTVGGTLRIGNAANLNMAGSVNNNGRITFTPTGSENFLNVGATALSISGAGTIQMDWTGSGGAGVFLAQSTGTLTLGANQVVQGVGSFRNSRVINNGLIDANSGTAAVLGAGIYIDPSNQGTNLFINNGTIRSSNGGLMVFSGDFGGEVLNNGTIAAIGDNSITELFNNVTVTGGTYVTTGTGVIRVRPGQTGNASGFTVTSGSQLQVPTGARLNISGTITNSGSININAGATDAVFGLPFAVTLQGGGITRFNSSATTDAAFSDQGTVTIAAGHVVRGDGYFNNTRVINDGSIIGDDSVARLGGTYIDPSNQIANPFVNNGTIQVIANNFVSLVGDNGGGFSGNGVYRADGANAFLHLANNVTVIGGNYTTTGGGVVRVPSGSTANLTDPTITSGSELRVDSAARLNLSGAVSVQGAINIIAGPNSAVLGLPAAVTLQGGGITRFNSTATTDAAINNDQGTLTIAAGHVVRGDGYLNNVRVINNGAIIGDDSVARLGGTYIDPSNQIANSFVNNGTIQVVAGNIVSLVGDNGGNFTGNGVYRADGASAFLQLANGVEVTGGNFTTTASGEIRVPTGNTANLTGSTLTAGSNLAVQNGSRLNLIGTVTNNGNITVTAGAANSFLSATGSATLAGTGVTRLTGNPTVSNATVDGQGTLTIAAGQTVAGAGYFNNARVINNGTILADQTGTISMYLDPSNQAANTFVNNGTFRATGGAVLTLAGDSGGNFSGNGLLIVDANSRIQAVNSLGGDIGPVSGAGTYLATSSSNAGHQNFRVANLVATTSGTARVTAGGGTLGTSKVNTLTINTSGSVNITNHDFVIDYTGASPTAALRPLILSAFNGGAWNGAGLTSSSAAAASATANKTGVGYAEATEILGATPTSFGGVSVDATSTLLRYTLSGDANLDFTVNITDFARLAAAFNTPSLWYNGDFNYDGTTNISDFALLAANFNKTLPADLPRGGTVPEPAAMSALLVLAGAMKRVRRH